MKNILVVIFTLLFCKSYGQLVTKIKFKGNYKTKEHVLKKLTSIKLGQPIDSISIKNDVDLISRLPSCSKSTYSVKRTPDNNYELTYILEETNTIIPSVNFWTSNNQHFAYQIGLNEYNFLGENKQLGAFYRNNGFSSFLVNYQDPFLFNATTGFSTIVQSLSSLEPLYFGSDSANYQYTNTSVEVSVIKRLSFSHKLNLGINVFQEKYNYVDGFQSTNIPQHLKELKLLLKTGFDYNRLKYFYQYVTGFRSLLNIQYVVPVTNSQNKFYILWNDVYYYKRFGDKNNVAFRLRAGVSSNDNNPFAPFALDNNLNIRGVGNIIDRGTAVVVLNAEYRYTLIDKKWFALQTNTFIDLGNWRSPGGKLKQLFEKEQFRLHPGLGLRFIHKKIYNAVFRLDYGRSILQGSREKGFVFGIGQYF